MGKRRAWFHRVKGGYFLPSIVWKPPVVVVGEPWFVVYVVWYQTPRRERQETRQIREKYKILSFILQQIYTHHFIFTTNKQKHQTSTSSWLERVASFACFCACCFTVSFLVLGKTISNLVFLRSVLKLIKLWEIITTTTTVRHNRRIFFISIHISQLVHPPGGKERDREGKNCQPTTNTKK